MPSITQIIRRGLGWLPLGFVAVAGAVPPTLSVTQEVDGAVDVSVAGGAVGEGWVLQDSYDGVHWRDLAVLDGRPVRYFLSSVPSRTRLFQAAEKQLATPQEALTQARQQWQAAGMNLYQYRSRTSVSGFLTDDLTLVQDGKVKEWICLLPPGTLPFSPEAGNQTIDAIFDWLQNSLNIGPHVFSARYHPTLGYPETAYVDESELIADEERGVTIAGVPMHPAEAREENEQRWEQAGPETYEFDLRYETAFDSWEGRIAVSGGSASVVSGGAPAQPHIVMTIDEIFASIETALADGKASMAAYHPTLGHPEFFSVDWNPALDEGERFWISGVSGP